MDAAHHDCFTVGYKSMQCMLEVTQMIARRLICNLEYRLGEGFRRVTVFCLLAVIQASKRPVLVISIWVDFLLCCLMKTVSHNTNACSESVNDGVCVHLHVLQMTVCVCARASVSYSYDWFTGLTDGCLCHAFSTSSVLKLRLHFLKSLAHINGVPHIAVIILNNVQPGECHFASPSRVFRQFSFTSPLANYIFKICV